jgi:hypothetical protein
MTAAARCSLIVLLVVWTNQQHLSTGFMCWCQSKPTQPGDKRRLGDKIQCRRLTILT